MKKSIHYKVFELFNYLIMFFIVASALYPFLFVIAVSFSREEFILAGLVNIIPRGLNVNAYKLVFEHPSFWQGYYNTIYYTVISVLVSLTMTTLCAYPLSKSYLPGRGFFIKMVMFTMFFGGGMIPNFLLVKSLGMYNSVWAITLPGAIGAWNVFIMMSFFQGIPEALEEAAEIDGLGRFGVLFRIVLPLSLPIIATMVLFFAVGQWNNWFGPLIYFSVNEKYPITLFLRNILLSAQQLATSNISADQMIDRTKMAPSEALKAAAIVLVSMPILILYPFAQKYFVKGVLIGSLKQ